MKLSIVLALSLGVYPLFAGQEADDRLNQAAEVLTEIMTTSDQAIPQYLLDRAYCIAIVPGLKKGGFIVGVQYGKGYVLCRNKNGLGWTGPASVRVEGGSFGFQIGASEVDVVMLIMNERGMERLFKNQFTLGGDATVAAGPVGRSASAKTGAFMTAEILTWSRSRGIFAGIALEGATLRQDLDENLALYGRRYRTRILSGVS